MPFALVLLGLAAAGIALGTVLSNRKTSVKKVVLPELPASSDSSVPAKTTPKPSAPDESYGAGEMANYLAELEAGGDYPFEDPVSDPPSDDLSDSGASSDSGGGGSGGGSSDLAAAADEADAAGADADAQVEAENRAMRGSASTRV